jgi:DNA-binding MarR family transcriptional regulator
MLLIELTESGRAAAATFRPLIHRHQKEWFGVLSEDEQVQFIDALRKLQGQL